MHQILTTLKSDLARYSGAALAVLVLTSVVGAALLSLASIHLAHVNHRLPIVILLAALAAFTSTRHALKLETARAGFSMSDCLVYLALILFGPYEGALLAAADQIATSHSIKARPGVYPFNVSNNAIAAFLAGTTYHSFNAYLLTTTTPAWGLTVVAMAATYYLASVACADLVSHLVCNTRIMAAFSERFPWEPAGHLASAAAAAAIVFVATTQGLLATAAALLVASPVPLLVYYLIRTYRDSLSAQDRHYNELAAFTNQIPEILTLDAELDAAHDHIQQLHPQFPRTTNNNAPLMDAGTDVP